MVVVEDISRQLPALRDLEGRVIGEPMDIPSGGEPEGIMVHHEGGVAAGSSLLNIANYHTKVIVPPWSHVGYAYGIDNTTATSTKIPKVFQLLPTMLNGFPMAGYHGAFWASAGDNLALFPNRDEQWYNKKWLSIVLPGNFELVRPPANMVTALVGFLTDVKRMWPGMQILGHGEAPGKSSKCPGVLLDMNLIRSRVDTALSVEAPSRPGPGDESWALETGDTWREVAIKIKGSHDFLMQTMQRLETGLLVQRDTLKLRTGEADEMLAVLRGILRPNV